MWSWRALEQLIQASNCCGEAFSEAKAKSLSSIQDAVCVMVWMWQNMLMCATVHLMVCRKLLSTIKTFLCDRPFVVKMWKMSQQLGIRPNRRQWIIKVCKKRNTVCLNRKLLIWNTNACAAYWWKCQRKSSFSPNNNTPSRSLIGQSNFTLREKSDL